MRLLLAVGLCRGYASFSTFSVDTAGMMNIGGDPLANLAVFGVGTIVGMFLVTASIAAPSLLAVRRFACRNRTLRIASGAASIAVGLILAHRIGIVDGLFTAAPAWTPQ